MSHTLNINEENDIIEIIVHQTNQASHTKLNKLFFKGTYSTFMVSIRNCPHSTYVPTLCIEDNI